MTQFVKISLVVALAFSWAYAAEAMADVYGYTDEVGAINLTDNPVNEDYVLLAVTPPEPVAPVLASLPSTFTSIESKPLEANTPYLDVINNAAETSGVEGRLLHAVITAESNYNPKALSPKGAQGLMQLMPRTARQYGVSNAFDPKQNIQGGARYLAYLLRLFDNDVVLSVAAYNAGENAVISHGRKVPPFRETTAYVSKVINLYKRYEKTAM